MIDKNSIIQSSEIPSIPEILQKILLMAEDPRVSARQLEELIIQEPGLVTHLLKTVNSAFYARPHKVDSIKHSIVILGMNSVRSICSGLMLINSFDNLSGVPKEYIQTVFMQSIVSANMMNIFAGKESLIKREPLYLAGMVNDIGHLILAQHFGEEYMSVVADDPFPSIITEKEMLEVDHSELGSALLHEWTFPDNVISLVMNHHTPETYDGDEKDIYYLKTCAFLSKQINDLDHFFSQDEEAVDDKFIGFLNKIDWNWPMLLENKDRIYQSIELARLLMSR